MMQKNWRTTLMGVVTAAAYAAIELLETGEVQPKVICIAAGIAALGYLSKDAGISGTVK
jgi:hypothetical protein